MGIVLKRELDPLFETLALLSVENPETWREEIIRDLSGYGLGGEMFYQKHFPPVEKYVRTFLKHKVKTPQEEFFYKDKSQDMFFWIVALAVENRRYLEDPGQADPAAMRRRLAYYLVDMEKNPDIKTEDDLPDISEEKALLEFMDGLTVKSEEKWYVLDWLRRPVYRLEQLGEMIRLNLPAFEKARDSVKKPLEKLLQKKENLEGNESYAKMAGLCEENQAVYMSMGVPLAQIVMLTCGYHGVLMEYLNTGKHSGNVSKEMVIRQAKALSDQSKLDILCDLKCSRKFNLELAESLGLSPSTVSHHMNSLLLCDFVTVEKRDGKVYYCLQEDTIREFLKKVEEMLL